MAQFGRAFPSRPKALHSPQPAGGATDTVTTVAGWTAALGCGAAAFTATATITTAPAGAGGQAGTQSADATAAVDPLRIPIQAILVP